jgi:hypothetical protein
VPTTDAYPTVQRTLAHRLTALLVAALFLFTWTGEALGAHACPHHDAVSGAQAMAHSDGGHGHHAAVHASHDAPAPQHADSHACTCQGTCPSVASGALPATDAASLRVAPASVTDAPAPRADGLHPRLVPFFLPYGQGPPRVG